MAVFSKVETDYLKSQRLGRIATVSRNGQPDVVPVMLEFDGQYFWVGSHNNQARKYRNVSGGNKLVAITVDDVESWEPFKGHALRVYGSADIVDHHGMMGQGKYLRITPKISWGFGLGRSIAKIVHKKTSPES